jgi:hypothetical protein
MADQQSNTTTLAQWQAIQAGQQMRSVPTELQTTLAQQPPDIDAPPQPSFQVSTPELQQPAATTPFQQQMEIPAPLIGKPIGSAFSLADGVIVVEACAKWTSAGRFDGQSLGDVGFIAGNH